MTKKYNQALHGKDIARMLNAMIAEEEKRVLKEEKKKK